MSIEQLSRAELLRSIYDKMSDDEKRVFIMMHLNNRSNDEIIQALARQSQQITDIQQHVDKNHWLNDFGANIAGNAVYGAAIWLLGRLARAIK